MLNQHVSAPLAPTPTPCLHPAARPGPDIDLERAPVVFGWLLYRQDTFADQVHLTPVYRLDRVGSERADHSPPALQPSIHYGQSTAMLRALLQAQQHTLLPPVAPGCRWRGPKLVLEVNGPAPPAPLPTPPMQPCQGLPPSRHERLEFARELASRLLRAPGQA